MINIGFRQILSIDFVNDLKKANLEKKNFINSVCMQSWNELIQQLMNFNKKENF